MAQNSNMANRASKPYQHNPISRNWSMDHGYKYNTLHDRPSPGNFLCNRVKNFHVFCTPPTLKRQENPKKREQSHFY